jgi:hypothetical protein
MKRKKTERRGGLYGPFELDNPGDFAAMKASLRDAPVPQSDFKTLFINRATPIGRDPVALVDAIWTNAKEGDLIRFAPSSNEAFSNACRFINAAAAEFGIAENERQAIIAKARGALDPQLFLNAENAVAVIGLDFVREMNAGRAGDWAPNFAAMRKQLHALMGDGCPSEDVTSAMRSCIVLAVQAARHDTQEESKTLSILRQAPKQQTDDAIVFILNHFVSKNEHNHIQIMRVVAAVAKDLCAELGYDNEELNSVFTMFRQSFAKTQ